jgi:hypothetical protein
MYVYSGLKIRLERKKLRIISMAAKTISMVLLCVTLMGLIFLAVLNQARMPFINPVYLSSISYEYRDLFKIPGSCTKATDYHNNKRTAISGDMVELELTLSKAANKNRTVIITLLNGAWAQNNSMLDLFMQSFRVGNGTEHLLKNLLIVAVDNKALRRCRQIHEHCYLMKTEGIDFSTVMPLMSQEYLDIMWRRVRFFGQVLEAGYNFIFSDTDILWFRDPFPRFSPSADMHFASDKYKGHPHDLQNLPNCGFMYVRSNERTISFFKFWHQSKSTYPGKNEQDVLNLIKLQEIRRRCLELIFLDTKYFRGYCQKSPDLEQVCTVHANCCIGLKTKLHDLRNTLSDWKGYMMHLAPGRNGIKKMHWTPARACQRSRHSRHFWRP